MITASERATLSALHRLCGAGTATLTTARIASEAGVSLCSVKRALASLAASGDIEKTGGQRRKNAYRLVSPADIHRNLTPDARRLIGRDDEDPPGSEYTQLSDPEAARADRTRLMSDRSWRPSTRWARAL